MPVIPVAWGRPAGPVWLLRELAGKSAFDKTPTRCLPLASSFRVGRQTEGHSHHDHSALRLEFSRHHHADPTLMLSRSER